jgi:hypothetical protein
MTKKSVTVLRQSVINIHGSDVDVYCGEDKNYYLDAEQVVQLVNKKIADLQQYVWTQSAFESDNTHFISVLCKYKDEGTEYTLAVLPRTVMCFFWHCYENGNEMGAILWSQYNTVGVLKAEIDKVFDYAPDSKQVVMNDPELREIYALAKTLIDYIDKAIDAGLNI